MSTESCNAVTTCIVLYSLGSTACGSRDEGERVKCILGCHPYRNIVSRKTNTGDIVVTVAEIVSSV